MTTLRSFLDDSPRPPGTLPYHELQGFLFAVACAPRRVDVSEWLPIVLGPEPPFVIDDEYENLLYQLMDLSDSLNAAVLEGRSELPRDCELRPEPIANLEADAPVAQWSRGFLRGHQWLDEWWMAALPEQAYAHYRLLVVTLGFFSSDQMVKAYFHRAGCEDLAMMAPTLVLVFADAIAPYASYGRMFRWQFNATERPGPRRVLH